MNNLSLGAKLKSIRFSKGSSAINVSKNIGIDRSYLSKIENGHEKPSRELLEKLIKHYSLSIVEATELNILAGYKLELVETQDIKGGEYKMENQTSNNVQQKPEVQVNLNGNTPVLYTDSAFVGSNQWGLILDFAQSMGPTNQQNVVARVGMSKSHAKAIAEIILKKLAEEDSKTQ